MALIRAADTMVDLVNVPGRFHALGGNRQGQYALEVSERERLIFAPADDPLPRTGDGGVDLSRVTTALILEVGDYHGG